MDTKTYYLIVWRIEKIESDIHENLDYLNVLEASIEEIEIQKSDFLSEVEDRGFSVDEVDTEFFDDDLNRLESEKEDYEKLVNDLEEKREHLENQLEFMETPCLERSTYVKSK